MFKEAKTGEVVAEEPSEEELERRKMVTAVNIFLAKWAPTPVKMSDVINISFSSYSPELAAKIANEIPEAYIVGQLEAKFEASQKVTNWLSEQLEELKTKVADSERAVEIYRLEKGLSEGAGTGLLAEQLSEINSQLIIAKAERAEAEVRLGADEPPAGREPPGPGNLDRRARSRRSSSSCAAQEAEVMRRRSELAVEYGPRHPRMLQVNAELDDINRRIDSEMDKVTVGLENEVERARLREQSLAGSLVNWNRSPASRTRKPCNCARWNAKPPPTAPCSKTS